MPQLIKLSEGPEGRADLEKALNDLYAAKETSTTQIGDVDSKVGNFITELAAVKTTLEKYGERLDRRQAQKVEEEGGTVVKVPFGQKEWGEFGMKAALAANVVVEKNGRGEFVESDGPFAKFGRSHDLVLCELALRGHDPEKAHHGLASLTTAYKMFYAPAAEAVWGAVKSAFNISNTGQGLEWVQALASQELQQRIRLGWRVVGVFPHVAMPRSPYVFPVFRSDVSAKYVPTPTSGSDASTRVTEGLASNLVTAKVTLTGKRLMSRLIWSWDFEEDSIVAAAAEMRDAAAASMSNAWEQVCLDGDSDGSHMDSDVGASTDDCRVAWDGLRKTALANTATSDVGGNALDSSANWNLYVNRGVFTKMKRYGLDRSKVAFISGTAVGNQVRAIDRFATAEVFTTALNKLANVNAQGAFSPDGIADFIASEFVREDLNNAGVYDGITTDKTYFLAVRKDAWRVGEMSTVGFKLLDQTRATLAQSELILTQRGDFECPYAFDTIHTGMGFAVTNS